MKDKAESQDNCQNRGHLHALVSDIVSDRAAHAGCDIHPQWVVHRFGLAGRSLHEENDQASEYPDRNPIIGRFHCRFPLTVCYRYSITASEVGTKV